VTSGGTVKFFSQFRHGTHAAARSTYRLVSKGGSVPLGQHKYFVL